MASLKSKIKSAAKKAVSNLKGNLGVIGDKVVSSLKKSNQTASVASNKITYNPTPSKSSGLNIPSLSTSVGGVTTSSGQPKQYTSNTTGGQKVAAANISPTTNYSALKSTPSKSSGGSSRSSGGSDPFANALPGTSTPSQNYGYTPSIQSFNTPITPSDLSTGSYVPQGGQTNAGLNTPGAYSGYGDNVESYINDYEKSLAQKRADAQKEQDTTLEYIQKQMEDAAADTQIDRADIEKQAGIKQLEQEASNYKSQILGIKAEFETKRQSLIGQGRGIPEVIIGGQQEALDRQEAIKLMPLLAQYQIANDNLEGARETVKNFIADEQAYLNRVYQTKISVLEKAYDLAVGKEKDAVNDFKEVWTMNIKSQQDANDLKLKIIDSYLDNKQKPPQSLLSYDTSNPNSQNDLLGYMGGVSPQVDGETSLPSDFVRGSVQSLDDIRNAPVSNITKAVMSGQASVKDLTPTDKKQVLSEMYAIGFDSKSYLLNKVGALYEKFVDVPDEYKGAIQGRIPFAEDFSAEVKDFESLKTILKREVARLNDVGMLSDQDVADYEKALPSRTTQSPQVILKALSGISTALTGRSNNIGDIVEVTVNGQKIRAMIGMDGDTLLDPVTGKEL